MLSGAALDTAHGIGWCLWIHYNEENISVQTLVLLLSSILIKYAIIWGKIFKTNKPQIIR